METFRVLLSDNLSPKGIEVLRSNPGLEVDVKTGLSPAQLAQTIGPYHALVIRSGTRVTREVIEAAHCLKVIGRAGVGVDNVDLEAATRRGIVVMNTPGGSSTSVAEQTIGFLISLARRIPQADASMKKGAWEKKKLTGIELRGKTLGLIGLGRI